MRSLRPGVESPGSDPHRGGHTQTPPRKVNRGYWMR
jgi:hypothetical protein